MIMNPTAIKHVVVDGHSLTDVSINSLRAQMGVMTQDNFLFSGTIRDNLLLADPNATDAAMMEALILQYQLFK